VSGSNRPQIVVLGMMTKMPVAGVVWQTIHYVLGFKRLGYDVHYVETHARTPSMLMRHEDDDGGALAAEFIASMMRRFDLGDSWAYVALHDDGRHYGMSRRRLHELYRSAGAILNLHGGTEPLPEFADTGRLVYVETDPVQLQVELHDELPATTAFLDPHAAFFTFAENLGGPDCGLPVSERFDFKATRQPVVADLWEDERPPSSRMLTTIGNWRQHWRNVGFEGNTYTWSKHEEFLKFVDLPRIAGSRFELALSSYEDADRQMLEERGWRVRHALDFSSDLDTYRQYIVNSAGEFTVAKDQNVRLRTGWFSDRSATYLAAGRPVITQETGFSSVLPTGDGLFAFETLDDVTEALGRIDEDYARQSRAAAEIGREYFGHEVVLGRMLDELGLSLSHERRPRSRSSTGPVFAYEMVLAPVSRRPAVLPEATVEAALGRPVPAVPSPVDQVRPGASVVVVSFDNLLFTRLCLESLLAHTLEPAHEVVVVDNGSGDGSEEYLRELAEANRRVKLVLNSENIGFPAACNQGLAAAHGDVLVLLNNDTMLPPEWLPRLIAHLEDENVGLVGPVTNRIGNEAEVPTRYHTWGEYLRAAEERARGQSGRSFDIETLTMFCVAMRRGVHVELGPLDTQFEVGTLEDDDYSLRARGAGYRLLCAEDVLVHHFGEASFGKLFADGEFGRIMEANRDRFARKWGAPWQPYEKRLDSEYAALTERVRRRIVAETKAGSTLLVVSRGDESLVDLDGRRAWHFPGAQDGRWAGHHPADSAWAIRELLAARARGADYIAFPGTAFWWLDFYEGLAKHLELHCSKVVADDDCVLFDLAEAAPHAAEGPATPAGDVHAA